LRNTLDSYAISIFVTFLIFYSVSNEHHSHEANRCPAPGLATCSLLFFKSFDLKKIGTLHNESAHVGYGHLLMHWQNDNEK